MLSELLYLRHVSSYENGLVVRHKGEDTKVYSSSYLMGAG